MASSAPAQYGERLRAAAVYLHVQQLIPEDRAAETLADLFGADRLRPASVMGWVKRKAKALAPVAERIGALAAAARVRCLDDPSTMLRTAFGSRARRNGCIRSQPKASPSIACRPSGATCPKTLPAGWSSTTASNPIAGFRNRSCALQRPSLTRTQGADRSSTRSRGPAPMRDLLCDANRAVDVGRGAGRTGARPCPSGRLRNPLPGHLARRPRLSPQAAPPSQVRHGQDQATTRREPAAPAARFKDDVLRFLVDFDVPFTNNLAWTYLAPRRRRRSQARPSPASASALSPSR